MWPFSELNKLKSENAYLKKALEEFTTVDDTYSGVPGIRTKKTYMDWIDGLNSSIDYLKLHVGLLENGLSSSERVDVRKQLQLLIGIKCKTIKDKETL